MVNDVLVLDPRIKLGLKVTFDLAGKAFDHIP